METGKAGQESRGPMAASSYCFHDRLPSHVWEAYLLPFLSGEELLRLRGVCTAWRQAMTKSHQVVFSGPVHAEAVALVTANARSLTVANTSPTPLRDIHLLITSLDPAVTRSISLRCTVNDRLLTALQPFAPMLQCLDLTGANWASSDTLTQAFNTRWPHLQRLKLHHSLRISDAIVSAWFGGAKEADLGFPSLQHLELNGSHELQHPMLHLPNLKTACFNGCRALAAVTLQAPLLEDLSLANTAISNDDVQPMLG